MAPRSSWKGFLKLSLVSVPVKAYTANATGSEIRMNQLHAECNNRVRYLKTCPEHGEVKNDEIVSGYEYSKGQYVIVQGDEIEKLRTKSDRSVNIDGFVPVDALDAVYQSGKTYYLVPDGPVGQKPYALLRDVMLEKGVHAVAQVILSGREQVVMLRPMQKLLAMTVLHFESKVKQPSSFEDELTQPEVSKAERDLTHTLIDASKIEEFDFSKYRDTYVDKLTQVIESKVAGEELVAVPDPEEPKILNLMDALKQSVARSQGLDEGEEETKSQRSAARGSKKKAGKKKVSAKMAPSGARAKKTTRKKKSS